MEARLDGDLLGPLFDDGAVPFSPSCQAVEDALRAGVGGTAQPEVFRPGVQDNNGVGGERALSSAGGHWVRR